jgi:hypothetical protein
MYVAQDIFYLLRLMSCIQSTRKKYTSRSSPPYPAQACKGLKKKGNDGKWYVSSPTSKGVYRWVVNSGSTRKAKGVKSYEVHDNGGRPFLVEVNSSTKHVDVFLYDWVGESLNGKYHKGKSVLSTHYADIFIGDNDLPDPRASRGKGNSILIHVSGSKYVYVGHVIQSFETRNGEKILRYYSPIGNSDVPYPYAVGENYTYFMLDMKTLPNNVLDLKTNAYQQYYGHAFNNANAKGSYYKTTIERAMETIRHKTICPRRY